MLKLINFHGQIVVEYILLLLVAIAIATIITQGMVSRNPDNTGFLILKWEEIIRFIGQDAADSPYDR